MKTIPLFLLLAAGAVSALHAADVSVYAVIKSQGYEQISTAAPTALATGGFTFLSAISQTTTGSVISATLQLPSAVVKPFGPVPGYGPFAMTESFDTEAAMTAVYGIGLYGFTILTLNDGTRTPSQALGVSVYPNTPTIANFAAAQNIDWTQSFTLQWGAFTGGTAADTIQLIISRPNGTELFSTPQFGNPGALNGTATSAVIPANTLVPGVAYTATLIFGDIITLDFLSYPGVPGVTAFATTTRFPMKAPGTVPKLLISNGTAPGSFDLTWNADIGRTYDLVWSPDLASAGWTRLFLVNATATTETRSDTPGVTSRFYRLQEPP